MIRCSLNDFEVSLFPCYHCEYKAKAKSNLKSNIESVHISIHVMIVINNIKVGQK